MKKPWTVMVYMAADNDLGRFAESDLAEMEKAVQNDIINVVTLTDWPAPSKTYRYLIQNGKRKTLSSGPNIASYKGECLSSFVRESAREFPADRYLLVLWGHGDGIDWVNKKTIDL